MAKQAKTDIEIIFEDEALVIVHKPAGYLSIPDRFVPEKPNLYHYLGELYEKIFIVHRLDKETSGLICFAKTEEAHKNLSDQFMTRTVDKIYLALVEGHLNPEEGTIDKAIAHSKTVAGKMVISRHGKASVTDYRVVETFKNFSLVEANIRTGRTHQIRVHFESIGHPLAVDAMYGRREMFLLSEIKLRKYNSGKEEEERPLMHRTSLHAFRLGLNHPTTGERLSFEAPLPKDFAAVLNQLRKWGKAKE